MRVIRAKCIAAWLIPGALLLAGCGGVAPQRAPTDSGFTSELRAAAAPWRTEAQIAKIPPRASGERFRFLVMGDSRTNRRVFKRLLAMAAGFPKLDFSVDVGDIVPGGQPQEFAFFYTQIEKVAWPFLVVEGNHERGPSEGRLYEELFGPTDYYFDHGGFRFVGLDNAKSAVTPKQLAWLGEVLTTDLRKVVWFHVPPSVIAKWEWHSFSDGAQELADLLAEKGVERVYVGHIHGFDAAEYKGVTYVLSGGAGATLNEQAAPGDFHHIVLVEALPDGLRETVYKLDGTSFVLDSAAWISSGGQ
jgi:3',5'-cyclic AMP phosphodiesterase CpdA